MPFASAVFQVFAGDFFLSRSAPYIHNPTEQEIHANCEGHDAEDIGGWQRTKNHILFYSNAVTCHGPLTRYAKLQVAHVPGMRGTFSPPPQFGDADMHHGTCVTHVPWGSLTSVFLRSRWRGKCSWHSRSMHNPQFYISGKRPILEHAIKRYIILTCTASHEQASETQVTYYQQPAESRSA